MGLIHNHKMRQCKSNNPKIKIESYLSCHYGMSQQYHFGATFLCFVTALTKSKYSNTDDDDIQTLKCKLPQNKNKKQMHNVTAVSTIFFWFSLGFPLDLFSDAGSVRNFTKFGHTDNYSECARTK